LQDLVNQRPFGNHNFYIFGHARTLGDDERAKLFLSGLYATFEEVPFKTIIWQPRLTKPEAQENSQLIKVFVGSDLVKTIWIIPAPELWKQYEKGNVTENLEILKYINQFKFNKKQLEAKEDDDLSDREINEIYKQISRNANHIKRMKGVGQAVLC
jgi:hypothetical protein